MQKYRDYSARVMSIFSEWTKPTRASICWSVVCFLVDTRTYPSVVTVNTRSFVGWLSENEKSARYAH